MPSDRALRILFVAPAYWPAFGFGGPIWMARGLNDALTRRGHEVEVLTTSLASLQAGCSLRSRTDEVDGIAVHYLATPLRYRWMGVTPSEPIWLRRVARPDVVHVFGFRDPVGTVAAAWCGLRGIPYVHEPLGMLMPQVRKLRLKRALDASLLGRVPRRAAAVVVTSERERSQVAEAGVARERIFVRGNGFPPTAPDGARTGALREAVGVDSDRPLVLYVGRVASGKGIEHLLETARRLPEVHVALVGPDDGREAAAAVAAAQRDPATAGRVHRLVPSVRPLELYPDADVFVLPSAGESFGMVAAEAAAAGTPVVVTDRCGVAEWLAPEGALVVPYEGEAIACAVRRVLGDADLRARLVRGGRAAAAQHSWDAMAERQEHVYREAIAGGG